MTGTGEYSSVQSASVDERLARCGAFLYDVEIISAIPEQGKVREEGIHYCGGWEDYEGMGISVVTAYDFVDQGYKIYLPDNLDELKTIVNSRQVLIGFNSDRFDNNVLAANGVHVPPTKSFDIWKRIVETQPQGQRRGFDLNSVLAANGLQSKSGSGVMAPIWAQRGQWGKLINYCLDDTKLELFVLRLACSEMLVNPKFGGHMKIEKPWEYVKQEKGGLFSG